MSKKALGKYREFYTDNPDLDEILEPLNTREVVLSSADEIAIYRRKCQSLLREASNLPALRTNDIDSFCTIIAQHPRHVVGEARTNKPHFILSSAWALGTFNGYDKAVDEVFTVSELSQGDESYNFRIDAYPSSRLSKGLEYISHDDDLKIVARRIQEIEKMVLTLIGTPTQIAEGSTADFLATCAPFIDSIRHNHIAQIMKDTPRDTSEALIRARTKLKIPRWSREEKRRRRQAGLETNQGLDESTFL